MGLYRRKDSPHWWMSFRIKRRRIFESTGTANRKLAQRIHAQRLTEILEGRWFKKEPERAETTFRELAEHYSKWVERQKGVRRKKGIIKILNKRFGKLPLSQISTRLVEEYQSWYLAKGMAPATVNRHLACLKHMCTKAVDWEMADEVELKRVRRVKLLPENNRRLRYLSKVESQALVDASEAHLKPIVVTALNTGMRKEEILSLEWEKHIDLRHGFILLDVTKNGDRREIPINKTLRETLQGLIRRLDSPYVFIDKKGSRYLNVYRSFKSALKRAEWERCSECGYDRGQRESLPLGNCPKCANEMRCLRGIRDFRFHDLRHTFASQLAMAGVDLMTIKELLGHRTLTMTLRYAHLAPGHKVKAVALLDKNGYDLVTLGKNRGAVGP